MVDFFLCYKKNLPLYGSYYRTPNWVSFKSISYCFHNFHQYNMIISNHNVWMQILLISVSDFTQQLSQLYEQHGESLQMLVSSFRKRNSELRKERWIEPNERMMQTAPFNAQCPYLYIYIICCYTNRLSLHVHRPSCPSTLFQTWETFLQEIEADSVTANDIAKTLSRQVRNRFPNE